MLQEGEDRMHPAMLGARLLQSELREDRADVLLDRADADEQLLRDVRVAASFGHEREHVALTRCERRKRIGPCRQQTLHDERIEHRAALADAADGIRELVE